MSAFASPSSVFRILMLCLLIAGVLAKPVVAFAGALHEAGHAESMGDKGHVEGATSDMVDPYGRTIYTVKSVT